MDKYNEVDKSGGSRIIKNLAKFKSLKNSAKCEKSIKNSVKFKISERFSFLSSTARLPYT